MQAIELEIPDYQTEIDWKTADEINIGDKGPVVWWNGSGVEQSLMRFGKPQEGRGPLFNFRWDGRDFSKSLRCIIPATGFYEFTGTKSPKSKHRFALESVSAMGIAGVWWNGEGNQPDSFAMLTAEPGPDIAPYHNRQIVILRPDDWRSWLRYDPTVKEKLAPLPAGYLSHKLVREGAD